MPAVLGALVPITRAVWLLAPPLSPTDTWPYEDPWSMKMTREVDEIVQQTAAGGSRS
jgi:hypothetical protein